VKLNRNFYAERSKKMDDFSSTQDPEIGVAGMVEVEKWLQLCTSSRKKSR